MAYDATQARRELLDDLAAAAEELAVGLAALSAAYERLDEPTGDDLEAALFAPLQSAYARLRRVHDGFAARSGLALPAPPATPTATGVTSSRIDAYVARGVEAGARADLQLADLQDSLRPVEVGDAELRAGLGEVRRLLAGLPAAGRTFARTLGR